MNVMQIIFKNKILEKYVWILCDLETQIELLTLIFYFDKVKYMSIHSHNSPVVGQTKIFTL